MQIVASRAVAPKGEGHFLQQRKACPSDHGDHNPAVTRHPLHLAQRRPLPLDHHMENARHGQQHAQALSPGKPFAQPQHGTQRDQYR